MRRPTLGLGLVLVALGACGAPTEVTLELSTNACGPDYEGVAIELGRPGGALERSRPIATTSACKADGTIGTFVVVPGSSVTEPFEARVVMGLGVDPSGCAAHGYAGCVVSRRVTTFADGEGYGLPIFLDRACAGVVCSAATTCVAGACVADRVAAGTCVSDAGCRLADADAAAPALDAAPDTRAPDAALDAGSTASCLATCAESQPMEAARFAGCVCDPMVCGDACGAMCAPHVATMAAALDPACAACVAGKATECDNGPCKAGHAAGHGGPCAELASCAASCGGG